MPKPHRLFLVLCVLILTGIACDESGESTLPENGDYQVSLPTPDDVLIKGNRRLEVHITDPENADYDQSIAIVKDLGAESINLSIFWDDFETTPGLYKPDPNWLEIANLYFPQKDMKVSLVISVLDTTEIRLPEDLTDKSLADPEVIQRFQSFLVYVKTQIPDLELTSLAIGNEIDGVLGGDQNAWSDFQTFFKATVPKARELWPDIPIGTKIQLSGLTGPMKDQAKNINTSTDVVMVTYYPLKADFSVKDPDVVLDDFRKVTQIYPDREIHFMEIGYPTSEAIHSSQEKQAEFIRYMFQAWDNHSEQITVLSFSWLTDLPPSSVRELESYYGLSDPGFAEFLRTLGLRTYPGSGTDKIGFQAFKFEAEARGW
jgi:hypothetical protein